MEKERIFYRKKPGLVWMVLFSIPAISGLLGFFTGLYMVFIINEVGLGVTISILMGLSALGFGSYVLTSIGPYLNAKDYYLKLEPEKLVFSKGKERVSISKEELTEVKHDVVRSTGSNLPAVYWTTIEYKKNGQTKVERFTDDEYGGHNFAKMIKKASLNNVQLKNVNFHI
jgi:hypothetical protein